VLLLLGGAGCAGQPTPVAVAPARLAGPVLDAPARLLEQEPAPLLPAPAPELPPAPPDRPARVDVPEETDPPTPAPPEQVGFVVRERVNLRPCPEERARCTPIASLDMNEPVRVLGGQEEWLEVHVPRLERGGFVARRFVAPRPAAASATSATTVAGEPTPGAPAKRLVEGARPRGRSTAPAAAPQEELLR
jgi:hypothetical protein